MEHQFQHLISHCTLKFGTLKISKTHDKHTMRGHKKSRLLPMLSAQAVNPLLDKEDVGNNEYF